ncbi:hypothetical protein MTBLM1_30175 [Rhodospirillaceae bacterium LM-1]|nr:hypothetical protein MTBLM1_30175 [Rhodospirillaceae bacterium LM-1]
MGHGNRRASFFRLGWARAIVSRRSRAGDPYELTGDTHVERAFQSFASQRFRLRCRFH